MKERDFWVLVVDDESDLALNLQDILRDRGYFVVAAQDGKTALDLCGEEGFDLGIIDMNLPDMQGDSLISSIAESCPGMDFVIMTGHGTVESAARNVGRKNIIAYETKPLDIGRMMSFIDQVVQRRTLEKSLNESETRFRNLFAHHSAIMLVLDPITGNIIDANNSAAQFYGWSIEQLKQMNIRQINTLPPTAIKSAMDDALTSKRIHFEFKHMLADGSIRDVEAFSNKIETAGKTVLYSIIHDITQRKLAEEAMKRSAERDCHIADVLQQAVMPSQMTSQPDGYEIATRYRPAMAEADICGDFCDIFNLDNGRIGIAIGDVTGKGLSAALRVSAVRNAIRCYAYMDDRPSSVMSLVNDALNRSIMDESDMLTAFFAVLDPKSGIVTYCNAGHEPPVLLRSETGNSIERLDVGGPMFIGLGKQTYLEGSVSLDAGDVLAMVTDGITEARTEKHLEMFGSEGLMRCISNNAGASAEQIADDILQDARRFAGGELSDDVAIVVVKGTGKDWE